MWRTPRCATASAVMVGHTYVGPRLHRNGRKALINQFARHNHFALRKQVVDAGRAVAVNQVRARHRIKQHIAGQRTVEVDQRRLRTVLYVDELRCVIALAAPLGHDGDHGIPT